MTGLRERIDHELMTEAKTVSAGLISAIDAMREAPARLVEAMRYSVDAGGKRLRPVLTLWCSDLCGGDRTIAMAPAMALECVHTFSLIHDDLPAIDNDDLRRGRPTSHKVFGEATAILAGDALLTLAFELIATGVQDGDLSRRMILELARATGASGMIGGELDDIDGEAHDADAARVARIHDAKTARLIQCACRLGAVAANADEDDVAALSDYGRHLGLAFQIADDLLDETGHADKVGKRTGKDTAAGKQTYPRVIGIDATRQLGADSVEKAVCAVSRFGSKADRLVALAHYVMERSS